MLGMGRPSDAEIDEIDEIERDLHEDRINFGEREAIRAEANESQGGGAELERIFPRRKLTVVTMGELLAEKFPPREYICAPVVQQASITMLHAIRGVGKTHVILGIAGAVASGGQFLGWSAPKPRRVLLIDGEMEGSALQERLARMVQTMSPEPPDASFLRIVTPDKQEDGPIPDLASVEGQLAVEDYLGDTELLILDNLSCLCRTGVENDAESWAGMQAWFLKLRRRRIATLLVHHSGKTGLQRGTSKREDVLDTVIALRQPKDYVATEGARFEVHFEKSRAFRGVDAEPFEARLEETPEGLSMWTTKSLDAAREERVVELHAKGRTQRAIATELGIGLGTVNRICQGLKKGGDAD